MSRGSLAGLSLSVSAAFVAALAGCYANTPDGRAEAKCNDTCHARAARCTGDECVRGCRFILDRLIEHEGDKVVACVASAVGPKSTSSCGDETWADCAARIGPHADGGPPAPPPPAEE